MYNRNRIKIIGRHTQRPRRRRLFPGDPRVRINPPRRVPACILDGIQAGLDELRATLPRRAVPAGYSVNTRAGVPPVPTFKGVRYLGKLSLVEAAVLRLRNFGHAVTRTGVYAR
ncbi:MAG: hypothetical protein ACK4S4_15690 [Pyrinomonadaceae bacterium]